MQENEILKQFQEILEAGKEAADWLDTSRSSLVERAVETTLNAYPEQMKPASSSTIDDFKWELEKYLKRISHCLTWSDYTLIDEPEGLKTFPTCMYQAAFKYIRDKRIEHNSPDVSNTAIVLLLDCFDHLIRRLD
ncbi:MAG: hypothetical protein HC899_18385 [Leptolyngbyaceae cyanobacterium SM1_4_3]|nr:hypothetical protein [Leptolyngbyaceae cyanobacterium SM1_4_3]